MEFEGKIWKDKKFWLIEVPALNIMTQGKTRKEALFMMEDAILEYVDYYFGTDYKDFKLEIKDNEHSIIISSNNTKTLLALSLRRQNEKLG